MPYILSVGTGVPENKISQKDAMEFARHLFSTSVDHIDRLLKVFHNGEIEKRHIAKGIKWYQSDHSFEEKNDAFIETAVDLSIKAIVSCLHSPLLTEKVEYEDIDAIFMICTTGLATPSLEARMMNVLPFSRHVKRIPIWGLGCAGGAAGLSRAYEYCRAFPSAKVLVVAVELCSLTFQKDDLSKSNLIGTSLFADGAAAALVVGTEVDRERLTYSPVPRVIDTKSTLLSDSLDVMGWDIKDEGLFVVFSKSIPALVENWLEPNVSGFLEEHQLKIRDIGPFIAHPGGKKVISAYEKALHLDAEKTLESLNVLRDYGNMSSASVLYVLKNFLNKNIRSGEYGIITALGPGFSSELLLVRWE
ncbi:MAG TPA: type III polyketide synthase [Bacillus bacterium]|uniref:Chalcone synthase n=1 Tax=Siminovitchia fordii TaxID=254759 RepID=A0ABQ4K5T6_9BACI|nr:3-oxoacyl-[acyl-carrier-protein] synthase III C-terminal domain-containing protein [Siminovitchia fordii]GIN21098.1 putative chalcone synthase [Siminovitchia fordii]HBZ09479.1 type III polyketide synthase [Bacillus sp. (in: firmicutes)]